MSDDDTGDRPPRQEIRVSNETSTRRSTLRRVAGATATLGVLGGLGFLGWEYITWPEVADFDVVRRSDAKDIYTVTVDNRGGSGNVLVVLRLRDEDNVVLEEFERTITMDARTERQLEFPVDPPERTDEYRFTVDAVDFPEGLFP